MRWVRSLMAAGILMVFGAIVARFVPFRLGADYSGNLSQWHAVCSGEAGQIAQTLSSSWSDNCQLVDLASVATWLTLIAGILLLAAAVFLQWRRHP